MVDEFAMYLRKSRKDNDMELHGVDTLERHEKILTAYAAANGLSIGKIYREVVSGDSIESRPEMIQLLHDVRQCKWRGVLVMEVERLARGDTKDQGTVAEAFKYSETLIVTPNRVFDPNNEADEEYFEFGLFMSRREYQTIKRRMQAGIKQSTLEGNYLCPLPPYGYTIVSNGKRNRTLSPHPEQAKIVQMIFGWYTQDMLSVCKIVRNLTDLRIPTAKGLASWSSYSVGHILENPAYIGKVTHGRYRKKKEYIDGVYKAVNKKSADGEYIIADGKHPPLVDVDTWNAAQARLSTVPRVKQDNELKNALAGILYCRECGKAMHQKITVNPSGRYSRYIHRIGTACPNIHGTASAREVMASVSAALRKNIADCETRLKSPQNAVDNDDMISALEKTLELLKSKKSRLFSFLEDGLYTKDEFLERKAEIQKAIDSTEASIAAERAKKDTIVNYRDTIFRLSEALNAIDNPDIPAKTKNDLLKQIVKRVNYSRKTCKEPFEIDMELL